MCFVIFSLLCLVRRIEIFAATHLFANVMIVLTIISVLVQGCIVMSQSNCIDDNGKPFGPDDQCGGSFLKSVDPLNK